MGADSTGRSSRGKRKGLEARSTFRAPMRQQPDKIDDWFGGIGSDKLIVDDDVSRLAGSAHGDDYCEGEDGNDQLHGQGDAMPCLVAQGGDGDDVQRPFENDTYWSVAA